MVSTAFPIFDQLAAATSNRERATILLRLSDGLVLEYGTGIIAACRALKFAAGAAFINERLAGLLAVRDAHGLLPQWRANAAEAWRMAISEFAAGKGDGVPHG
jgi:hypothetical protein